MKDYDYSSPGAYFVTICSRDKGLTFGKVVGEQVNANRFGMVLADCWNDLPNHFPNVALDAFVVMPNHVHGIIVILDDALVGAGLRPAPTKRCPLSEIVRAFKSFSARRINEIRNTPGQPVWQRNYFDHIIRDSKSLDRIREYVRTNPQRWSFDKENPSATVRDHGDSWLRTFSRNRRIRFTT